jgi:AP-3 complex subunit delta-1
VKQADQNLKYLGLVGFSILMQSHPHVLNVPEYRPLILHCLTDPDVTIRTRALDLLTGMASKKNLIELITQLLNHVELATGSYKKDLVSKIIEMCSGDKYSRMVDFKWYLDVLFQLGHYRGIEEHGDLLMGQVTNVALRVAPVRPYAVRRSIELLLEGDGITSDSIFGDNGRGRHLMIQLLPSLAWIIGEYSDQIQNALFIDPDEAEGAQFSYDSDSKGTYHAIVQCLSTPLNIQKLPTSTQKVNLQAAMKTFAAASKSKSIQSAELEACVSTIYMNFPFYMQSIDVEVAERSSTLLQLMKALRLTPNNLSDQTEDISPVVHEQSTNLLKIEEETRNDPISTMSAENGNNNATTLEYNIKHASDTLVYLLKSTPMKPAPSKSQKKKRETPLGITIDIEVPIDLSIFHDLILEDESSRTNGRSSIKAVSFTQQTPYRVVDPVADTAKLSRATGTATAPNNPSLTGSAPPSLSKPKRGDPFYLDSIPSADSLDETDERRFEAIQLPDSSDDESRGRVRQKKPKKVKNRKSTTNPLSDWPAADQAVFDSDDDDDNTKSSNRKGSNREFASLARVDLTTPLRDDEVMPQRTHHVVQERKQKTEKKTKKAKKKVSKMQVPAVGDLLDLSGMYSESVPSLQILPSTNTAPLSTNDNPINSAFDDLLSMPVAPLPSVQMETFPANNNMTTPTTLPHYPLTSFNEQIPTIRPKRPWLKGTFKTSSASDDIVDWSSISVQYQVKRLSDDRKIGGVIQIKVDNRSERVLNGVLLDVKDYTVIPFHNISAMTVSSQSDKIGPVYFDAPDSPKELKAVLRVGATSSIAVKIILPVSLFLNPVNSLSLERVAQELSTSDWLSTTAKVDLVTVKDSGAVKECLRSFLRADLVEGSELSPETATYAAYSTSGAQIYFLVKIKDKSVKVDIKSKSGSLSKALAADLKRLII